MRLTRDGAGAALLAVLIAAASVAGATGAGALSGDLGAGPGDGGGCWTETQYEHDYSDDAAGFASPASAMSTLRCAAARDAGSHAVRRSSDQVAPPGYDAAVATARQGALERLYHDGALSLPDQPADGAAATWTAHDDDGRPVAELVLGYHGGAWYPMLERYQMPEAVCDMIERWQSGTA